MNRKTIIHLLSGGLDSVTMLYHLHLDHNVHCLMFDYGQRHSQELTFAKYHASRLGLIYTTMSIPQLGGLSKDTNWIVPNRNTIFVSLGVSLAVRAGADTVTIGCNKDDVEFPDCSPAWLEAMNAATRAAGYDIEICAPFADKGKWEILPLAKELGVESHMIWTCYQGGAEPCGTCPACIKLARAKK